MSKQKININLSQRDLISLLNEKGWKNIRNEGHIIYAHPNHKERVVLSHKHGKIGPGIIRKILNIVNEQCISYRNFRGSI